MLLLNMQQPIISGIPFTKLLCQTYMRPKVLNCYSVWNRYKSKTSSNQWTARQQNDPYVKQRNLDNYLCRSAYKLLEINETLNILKPGDIVIDCGCAPGSWSQVAVQLTNATKADKNRPVGVVLGLDLQEVQSVEGALFFSGCDITQKSTHEKVKHVLQDRQADVLLSDMGPRATGVASLDHTASVQLCTSALILAREVLRPGGTFITKVLAGAEVDKVYKVVQNMFSESRVIKPAASRSDSAEMYLFGRGFRKPLDL